MDKLSHERQPRRTLKIEQYQNLNGTLLVLEKDLKQFQTQVIEGRIAYAYLR